MKIAKKVILLITFIASTESSIGQKIEIGKPYQDILLRNVVNYSKENALLSTFNDKPLIIDFWFIGCTPCMELVPHLDSLQKANPRKFNILLATFENRNAVLAFTKKNPVFRKFPIITDLKRSDSLMLMFPHTKEPHEIWIDRNKVVQAITSNEELTTQNLVAFLNGASLSLSEKKELTPEQRRLPLFLIDREFNNSKGQLFYSYISEYDPKISNVSWGVQYAKENNTVKALCLNCMLDILYKVAYDISGPDKVFFNGKSWSENQAKKTPELKLPYSYELIIRDTSISKARKIMHNSLDNYFSLQSKVKQVEMPCYILSRLENRSDFISKDETPANNLDITVDKIIIKNIGIDFVINNGLYNNLEHEVLNETDYNGRITVTIPRTKEFQKIKKELNRYGLDINIEKRKREIIFLENIN